MQRIQASTCSCGSRCYGDGHCRSCCSKLAGVQNQIVEPATMPSESTVHIAIELSVSSWLIAARLPGAEKSRLHRVEGGNTAALLTLMGELRSRASAKLGRTADLACCFEAGRDGFWLQRLLSANGIDTYVLEPTSILVNRRARRAKTDRIDAEGMLRVLAAWLGGDRQVCSMVRVPTPDEEDAKRTHREREHLVQEKQRIENRIQALLVTQGIGARPSLRSWARDMAELRTGDGRALPPLLRTELNRLRRRLILILELIRELEAERAEALAEAAAWNTAQPQRNGTPIELLAGQSGQSLRSTWHCEPMWKNGWLVSS